MAPIQSGRGHYLSEKEEAERFHLVTVGETVMCLHSDVAKVSLQSDPPSCEQTSTSDLVAYLAVPSDFKPMPPRLSPGLLRGCPSAWCLVLEHRLPSMAVIPLFSG